MGCREVEAQQKRLPRPGIAFDGLHRPIAKQVRHVPVTLDRYLLLVELAREAGDQSAVDLGRVRSMIEIVGTAPEYSEEVVVAALQGTEIRQVAEMPFADQRGAIAHLFRSDGRGGMGGGKPTSLGLNGSLVPGVDRQPG
jgi:hypothetical protein